MDFKINDHDSIELTFHRDNTVSIRMDTKRALDLARDGAYSAGGMVAHVGSNSDQYEMWRAKEMMHLALCAVMRIETGRLYSAEDREDAIQSVQKWDEIRTSDGYYGSYDV